jgi:hypothetical protein
MSTEACNIPPHAARLAPKLRALADRKIYFGTSSWRYDEVLIHFTLPHPRGGCRLPATGSNFTEGDGDGATASAEE